VRVALAGDTMLGRGVADALRERDPAALVAPDVVALAHDADLFVLNLECCISEGGRPWPAPGKPFHFRAPPEAADLLVHLGVRCVTLANNHALDFGREALLETFEHLAAAGIAWVGAGGELESARVPVVLEAAGERLCVVALSDHPEDFAATPDLPGIAWADVREGLPGWVPEAIGSLDADHVLVSPHWGPNMNDRPLRYVRRAAAELLRAGASLVAGHSAHVVQGAEQAVLYDLGDFLDDYRVDPRLRNDLGLLFLVDLAEGRPRRLEAVPLKLEYCFTRLADGDEAAWIGRRFEELCAELGTRVAADDGRVVIDWT
jgi:poly-gamma-glutamate capsule biosynthesis protein CapA/YwtB (metallophosphatase superfamily)